MPVCPDCGVAYLPGESHACGRKPSYLRRLLPSQWSRHRCALVFGLIAGFVWAMTPFGIYGIRQVDQLLLPAVAGPITGAVMAFLLAKPLSQLGGDGTTVVGFFALPMGAFVFGAMMWGVDFLASLVVPGGRPPLGDPIDSGFHALVGLAWVWPLTLLATPVAIWTSFQLRGLVETRSPSPPAS